MDFRHLSCLVAAATLLGALNVAANDETRDRCLNAGLSKSAAASLGLEGTSWEGIQPERFELDCLQAYTADPENQAVQTAYGRLQDKSGQASVAEYLYGLAAKEDYPPALFGLGKLGLSLGNKKPTDLIFKAATSNYPPAQYELGLRYRRGDGVLRIPSIGIHWIMRAARADYLPAIEAMAEAHRDGTDVVQDEVEAAAWQDRATRARLRDIHETLRIRGASAASFAALTIEDAGPDENALEDKKRCIDSATHPEVALKWGYSGTAYIELSDAALPVCEAAAASNPDDDDIKFALGLIHYKAERYAKTLALYAGPVDRGHVASSDWLGGMYLAGLGVKQNDATAYRLMKLGAEEGYASSQYQIAYMLRHGRGVRANYSQAMEWYLKAAEQGHANAQNNVAVQFYEGTGVPKSYASAAKWYRAAAAQGIAESQFMLGVMSYKGQGMARDRAAAKRWYKLAADQGHERAIEEYDDLITGDTAGAVIKEIGPTLFEYWLNSE